jgi:hypothetical protein
MMKEDLCYKSCARRRGKFMSETIKARRAEKARS